MRLGGRERCDVEDGNAAGKSGVGDQGAVTAPRNGFGAHDGGLGNCGEFEKFDEGGVKRRRLHVVGVAAEGVVIPGGVWRILARFAQAAQFWNVDVLNASFG